MYLGISPLTNSNTHYNTNLQVKFAGSKLHGLFTPDIFETNITPQVSNKIFEDFLNSIDAKIHRDLQAFTPRKLENAIQNLLKDVPNTNEHEILTVMQRLTQWANYTCLPKLGDKLTESGIGSTSKTGGVNNCFDYLKRSKGLIPSQGIDRGYFITKNTLYADVSNCPAHTQFINLEGFDDGVNLFNSDQRLEELTRKAFLSIKNLMAKFPQLSFDDALNIYLNGRIIKTMKERGLNVETFRIKGEPTRETILTQMAPYRPDSKDTIKTTIETVARFFTKKESDFLQLRNNIADFYESKLEVYSKQRIIKSIDMLKTLINKFLMYKKLTEKDLYMIIPNECGQNKSFGLMTEMFARENNVSRSRIATIDDISELNNYPKNSAFIILDDLTCSGDALTKACNYDKFGWRVSKDKHILFCPISAHRNGIDSVQQVIEWQKRTHEDKILTIKKNIREHINTDREVNRDEYFKYDANGRDAYGYEGYNSAAECLVFPYTTPDNNTDLASFLAKYFLPNSNGVKNKHVAYETIEMKIENELQKILKF